jgi:cytochrome c oxidase subunit IV
MSTRATFVLVWLACLLLLGGNIALAHLDLGALAPLPVLAIATLQALLILLFFLHVRRAAALVRLAAFAAFFFVLILFGLSLGDYLTRDGSMWPPELAAAGRP